MAYENSVYEYNENGELCVRVTGVSGGGGDQHNLGWYETQSALETAHPTAENGDWAIVGSTDTVWVWDSDTNAWKDTDQKGQVASVNGQTGTVVLTASDVGAIPQVSTMPTATADNVGNIVQYIGETDENYTNGYFYKSANKNGIGSGEIDVDYWIPDQFTPPVTGSVDIDVFSQYLAQHGLPPVLDGIYEIYFQPNNNNINFGYNLDTDGTYIDIPWNTVTTQSAEDIFANMGFDFDFSGIPTNIETVSGGQLPSGARYFWEEQPVMGGLGVYKDSSEMPEPTAENVGTVYLVTPYDSDTMHPYTPDFYMSVPYIVNFIDGEAEVTGYGLRPDTQPTSVMINWVTLDNFLSAETGFDWANDTINIFLNAENYLDVRYNNGFSASASVQTDGTVAGIQQALEDIGITVDLTGYTEFSFLNLKLPTEKGYENRTIPVFVPESAQEQEGYVLKTHGGGGGSYWAKESGGLPDQTGQSGKFLTTDGANASWGTALQNTATHQNSVTIEGRPASANSSTNVGKMSIADSIGTTAYGWYSEARALGATAIGSGATVRLFGGIALGRGAETQDGSFVIALWNDQKHTYKMCDLSGYIPSDRLKNAINKYSVMPTASVDNHGWIVQFTGTTDSTYTHGHLYECVTDGIEPITYSWTEVQLGGGGSTSATATLAVAGWSGNSQTVNVTGVTASNNVIVAPAPASQTDYTNAGVKCTAQGAGTLTFVCDTTPTSALTVNVLII